MPVEAKLGTLVDVAIKGVRVVGRPSASVFVRIADEHGDVYAMPPQAAITQAQPGAADITTLQERVSKTLEAIDDFVDEQKLDPWTAHRLRKTLDPNPRHWPPQPGDVWDDGMPFGGSLWFAQVVHGDSRSDLVMVPEEHADNSQRNQTSPEELLASAAEVRLAYRRKTGDND